MKFLLLYFLGLCISFVLLNKISYNLIPNRTSFELPYNIPIPQRTMILPWLNFDGKHYLTIALNGYPKEDKLSAYFPVYPLLIRFFSLKIFNPILVGLIVSIIASFLALLLLYKFISLEYSIQIAQKFVILFMLSPASFYFFSFYTEGLFLLLVSLFFMFVKKHNLFMATLVSILASATRIIGLALIPILIWEGFKLYKKTRRFPFMVLLSPGGFVTYLAFTYLQFGNPFLVITSVTQKGFDRSVGLFGPLIILKSSLANVLSGPQSSFDSPFVYPVIVIEFATAIIMVITLIKSYHKINFNYWLYFLFATSIIFFSGSISSITRYSIVIFPMYLFLSIYLPKKTYLVWCLLSAILLIFGSSLFLRGYWFA